jgi:chorismate mutase
MTTQERLAKERKEIASRVANFKATQQKFQREREEYYATTMENARNEPSRHA